MPLLRAIYSHINNMFCFSGKSNLESPWEGFMKGYINGPGHMTKMVVMPIPGKSKRKAMNRNWYNQKANPALNTKAGNK